MTALARQSVALELAFYGLLRAAKLDLADYEKRLETATNDIEAAALRVSIKRLRAAIAAAEAV